MHAQDNSRLQVAKRQKARNDGNWRHETMPEDDLCPHVLMRAPNVHSGIRSLHSLDIPCLSSAHRGSPGQQRLKEPPLPHFSAVTVAAACTTFPCQHCALLQSMSNHIPSG